MTAASREFCILLETMGTAELVIQPFIVYGSKTHRDIYYKHNDQDPNDWLGNPTFAGTESGYMDDQLGYYHISKPFEQHTQRPKKRPPILIVDSDSLHICWPGIQHALTNDTRVIQLPLKSTHLLQPLNVGSFALLQPAYKCHLRAWLLNNPLSVICKEHFLGLLCKAQKGGPCLYLHAVGPGNFLRSQWAC